MSNQLRKISGNLLLALILSASSQLVRAEYSLQQFVIPGAFSTNAWGINNAGAIAGSYQTGGRSFGYLKVGDQITHIPGPAGSVSSNAFGVSDAGVVVGSFGTQVDPATGLVGFPASGFVFDGTAYELINAPGALSTVVRGISPDGDLLAGHASYRPDNALGYSLAFAYRRSTSEFRFLTPPIFTTLNIAQGSNAAGIVVGHQHLANGERTGFTYDMNTGVKRNFVVPGYVGTAFRDINASGTLAGFFDLPSPPGEIGSYARYVGFVGTPDNFELISVPGAAQTAAQGINDSGVVVGSASMIGDGISFAIISTPVPEASTLALWSAGVFGILAAARRGRARAPAHAGIA